VAKDDEDLPAVYLLYVLVVILVIAGAARGLLALIFHSSG
jgi:hypothetical protein